MLKRLVNELRCTLSITTEGPLLVKSGHASVSGPDMTPVRTYRNNHWEVYLPGSSLKGVFRSHLEKVCRTLNPGVVCNPFIKIDNVVQPRNGELLCPEFQDVFCGSKFEMREKGEINSDGEIWRTKADERLDNPTVYADSCPICRLFGSTSFIGRLSIGDAYLAEGQNDRTERRNGVGIDRFTGGTAHRALFDMEVVSPQVTFETEVLLRNFETWQVGMFMVVVADLRDGLIRIGSGRSRGLGAVKGQIKRGQDGQDKQVCLTISYVAAPCDKLIGEVWGLGKLLGNSSYGTQPDDILTLTQAPQEETRGLRRVAMFTGEALTALETAARDAFVKRLDNWQVRDGMQWDAPRWERRKANE